MQKVTDLITLKKAAVAYGRHQLLPGHNATPPFGVALTETKGASIKHLLGLIEKTPPKSIAAWALWFWAYQQATHAMHYDEVRPMVLEHPPLVRCSPGMDCSTFATLCCWLHGLDDPNGCGYDGAGDCVTLMEHGVKAGKPAASDLVFYCSGAKGPGVPTHVAVAISTVEVVSMGMEGDPAKRALHDCGGGLPFLQARRYT